MRSTHVRWCQLGEGGCGGELQRAAAGGAAAGAACSVGCPTGHVKQSLSMTQSKPNDTIAIADAASCRVCHRMASTPRGVLACTARTCSRQRYEVHSMLSTGPHIAISVHHVVSGLCRGPSKNSRRHGRNATKRSRLPSDFQAWYVYSFGVG